MPRKANIAAEKAALIDLYQPVREYRPEYGGACIQMPKGCPGTMLADMVEVTLSGPSGLMGKMRPLSLMCSYCGWRHVLVRNHP